MRFSEKCLHGMSLALVAWGFTGAPVLGDTLYTTNATTNGGSGNIFDIKATQNAITINGFYQNFRSSSSGSRTYSVYYRDGSVQGLNYLSPGWGLLGTATAFTPSVYGDYQLVTFDEDVSLTINAGELVGIMAVNETANFLNGYTNGTGFGNLYSSDSYLSIYEGSSVDFGFTFTASPRIWGGGIAYVPIRNFTFQGPKNFNKIDSIPLLVGNELVVSGEIVLSGANGGSPFPNIGYELVNASSDIIFTGSVNQDLVDSTLLSYGADLVVGNDGDPTTFDIAWLPKNRVGVVGSALARLGNNESNQKSTAGVLDSSFKNLAIAAANTTGTSGKNATGEAIGNTGFTTGQAAAAGYSSDYIQLLDDLVQLSSPSQLAAAINSLSPEPYAAFQAVGLNSLKQQRELLATHAGSCQDTGWVVSMPNTESSVPGKTGAKLPVCVFADAAKSNSSINGSEGLSSYLSNSNVAYWGLEYFPSKQWTVGAAYGYGSSSLYGMSLTSAGVSSTNNSGAVYGVYKPIERLKLQTAFGYTGFSVEGTRTVSFIGNGQPINGNTSANGYTTSFDAKYDIPINTGSKKDWLVVSPIAGIAWGAYQQKGFEETGGGATDLQVNGHTSNSLVGTIGFELSTTPIKFTKSGKQSFAPKLALAYQVDALANANYTKELTASFVDAPGAGVITTQGQNGGANSFTIAAGGDLQVYENAALYATVSYEVENAGSQFGYSGGVRFLF